MKVRMSGGDAQSDTCVLSELLVFWDAPNRLGGYGNTSASGEFAPVPGSCPYSFTFKTTLPTQYTEEPDGEAYPLPPSFDETLDGIPGFRCVVRYAISVRVTRVRDMRVKSLRAQWKRKTVLRTPVVYRPKTRPSQAGPFPVNSKPNAGPVTRFDAMIESGSLFIEPIRTMVRLIMNSSVIFHIQKYWFLLLSHSALPSELSNHLSLLPYPVLPPPLRTGSDDKHIRSSAALFLPAQNRLRRIHDDMRNDQPRRR